jgi:hypothetical protein
MKIMAFIIKNIKINYIEKRHMQTAPCIKDKEKTLDKPFLNEQDTRQSTKRKQIYESDSDEEEIKVDPLPAAPKYETSPKLSLDDRIENLKKKLLLKDSNQELNDPANQSCEPARKPEPLFVPPILNKETLLADVIVKTVTCEINEIGERLGKEVKKSNELALEWKQHILALDQYIKSLSGLPWKKLLTYSACTLTVLMFLYKMGIMRMIPNFMSNVISIIPLPKMDTTSSTPIIETVKEMPKPSIRDLLDTPLTPVGIVTGIGVATVTVGSLKLILWVLRKVPK